MWQKTEGEAYVGQDIRGRMVGVPRRIGERLGVGDRSASALEKIPGRKRYRQQDVIQRRDAEEAPEVEMLDRDRPLLVLVHHQEPGQQDEKVNP